MEETSESDGNRLFEATEAEARKLAEVFEGTYFHPIGGELEDVFQEARIKWIDLPDSALIVGQTLADAEIRSRTRASIIAIQRDQTTIPNPEATMKLQAGDVLVAVASEDQHQALEQLLVD